MACQQNVFPYGEKGTDPTDTAKSAGTNFFTGVLLGLVGFVGGAFVMAKLKRSGGGGGRQVAGGNLFDGLYVGPETK